MAIKRRAGDLIATDKEPFPDDDGSGLLNTGGALTNQEFKDQNFAEEQLFKSAVEEKKRRRLLANINDGTDTGPDGTGTGDGGGGGGTGGGGGGGGTGGGGGGGGTTPPIDPSTGQPYTPIGTEEDIFNFNTIGTPIPGVPNTPYYTGDDGPNLVTDRGDGTGVTTLNPDGSVRLGQTDPVIREVQEGELVENRLSGLLNSDSKFIQDARRQGLEQANALGGLGGTIGAGASMQAAIRAGLPIAQQDAATMAAAAKDNHAALNQFVQMNIQRASQLELAQIDRKTRTQITQIGTSAQMAAARLQSATQRDISFADNETKLRMTEMGGQIQGRLADLSFRYSSMLEDQKAANELGNTGLAGAIGLENTKIQMEMQREMAYLELVTNSYDAYMERIGSLNGLEMDNDARKRALATFRAGYENLISLINDMYPDKDPITYDNPHKANNPPAGG